VAGPRERIGGRYKTRILGNADDLTPADGRDVLAFDQALRCVTNPSASAPVGKMTVAKALTVYFATLKSSHALEYKAVADRHIVPTLGDHRVDRLTKTQIEQWQAGLVRDDPEDPDARRRSQDTANRILTHFEGGSKSRLRRRREQHRDRCGVATGQAVPGRGPAREDDFDPKQVRLVIAKAATFDLALAQFIEAAYLTGARPGELAACNVSDLDVARRTLRVPEGKTGQRVVTLTDETAHYLQRVTSGRKRDTPLLPRVNGERWPRSGQCRPMVRALALAELPASASMYTSDTPTSPRGSRTAYRCR
jgi:integrase